MPRIFGRNFMLQNTKPLKLGMQAEQKQSFRMIPRTMVLELSVRHYRCQNPDLSASCCLIFFSSRPSFLRSFKGNVLSTYLYIMFKIYITAYSGVFLACPGYRYSSNNTCRPKAAKNSFRKNHNVQTGQLPSCSSLEYLVLYYQVGF